MVKANHAIKSEKMIDNNAVKRREINEKKKQITKKGQSEPCDEVLIFSVYK